MKVTDHMVKAARAEHQELTDEDEWMTDHDLRRVIEAALAAVQQGETGMALVEEAFFDGYHSRATYNDVDESSPEEEWSKVCEHYAKRITGPPPAASEPKPVAWMWSSLDHSGRVYATNPPDALPEWANLTPLFVGPSMTSDITHQETVDELMREIHRLRVLLRTTNEYQRGECWYWQGDGSDHLESLCASASVVISAEALRALIAVPRSPRLTVNLPDGDTRTARVVSIDRKPDEVQVCIVVEDVPAELTHTMKCGTVLAPLIGPDGGSPEGKKTADSNLAVHITHCNFGEHSGSCKYGDYDCPALTPAFSWIGSQLDKASKLAGAARETVDAQHAYAYASSRGANMHEATQLGAAFDALRHALDASKKSSDA